MIKLTPELIYKDLYNSACNNFIKYGFDKDLASRKANIYAVKNTWYCFSSKHSEALDYRNMLSHQINGPEYITSEDFDNLIASGKINKTNKGKK